MPLEVIGLCVVGPQDLIHYYNSYSQLLAVYGIDHNQGTPEAETEELQMEGQPGLHKTVLGNKHKQNKLSALKIAYSVTNQLLI